MHVAVCVNISVVLDQCVSLDTHCSCSNYNSQAMPVFDCSILAVHVYFFCYCVAVYSCSVTLRVVTLPSASFDDTTSVTFKAAGIGMDSLTTLTRSELGYVKVGEDELDETQDSNDSALDDINGAGSTNTASASFNVTFYHCAKGGVWMPTTSILDGSDNDTSESCPLCSVVVEGETEVRATVCCRWTRPWDEVVHLLRPASVWSTRCTLPRGRRLVLR